MVTAKRRGGAASLKTKSVNDDKHILLARGLSARFVGANIPLSGLNNDEMERDLRHIEAFSNACIAYSQQYFIYQNQNDISDADGVSHPIQSGSNGQPQPLVTMPVTIDPEEEKRLAMLQQKIENTESQREIMESQYLSLRAHYVYISQVLKKLRGNINDQLDFLQSLVRKRGGLVSIQRARLQMARDTLACLKRQNDKPANGKSTSDGAAAAEDGKNAGADADAGNMDVDGGDKMSVDSEGEANANANDKTNALLELWKSAEAKLRQAEELCHEGGGEVMTWSALKVPKTPPGVPLFVSQLSSDPGYSAAYACNGMFGSSQHDLCWLVDNLADYSETADKLAGLRQESKQIQDELNAERHSNQDYQNKIIACRKKNDELVAAMTFLRTETEAVVTRHNLILESEEGKQASLIQHKKEEEKLAEKEKVKKEEEEENAKNAAGDGDGDDDKTPAGESKEPSLPSSSSTPAAGKDIGKKLLVEENNENDGDDEGQVGDADDDDDEEEEEGEVVDEAGEGAATEKRTLDEAGEEGELDSNGQKKKRRKI